MLKYYTSTFFDVSTGRKQTRVRRSSWDPRQGPDHPVALIDGQGEPWVDQLANQLIRNFRVTDERAAALRQGCRELLPWPTNAT